MSIYSHTTFFYKTLRVYTNLIYKAWFSSIEINGEGNIPEGEPVIFAPNHQNAFIDAMALLSSSPQPVVFWARADLFNNKIIGAIMRAIKIMPAYRLRNGFSNLKKNEESIKESDDVLLHKQFLCLMPEGGQDEKRKLRPLVKGIFRSAFSAQEQLGEESWVKIVPTGIDYGNYDKSGRHLIVSFGKPINIKDYKQLHDENAPVALNKIKDDLACRMDALMLNIKSEEHYNTFYTASYLYNLDMLNKMCLRDNETNRLAARKKIVALLEEAEKDEQCKDLIKQLDEECANWEKNHQDVSFCAKTEEYKGMDADLFVQTLYVIFTSPLFLYGLVANCIGFLGGKIFGKKVRGSGFESSVKFGFAGLVSPFAYIIETIIFAIFFSKDALSTAAFALTLPFSFSFLLRYRWKFQYVKERFRNIFKKYKEPSTIRNIIETIQTMK